MYPPCIPHLKEGQEGRKTHEKEKTHNQSKKKKQKTNKNEVTDCQEGHAATYAINAGVEIRTRGGWVGVYHPFPKGLDFNAVRLRMRVMHTTGNRDFALGEGTRGTGNITGVSKLFHEHKGCLSAEPDVHPRDRSYVQGSGVDPTAVGAARWLGRDRPPSSSKSSQNRSFLGSILNPSE